MTKDIHDTGILIRSYHFGEQDLITHWFCENHGLQKAFVKRPRSKNRASHETLDLYSVNELHLKRSNRGGDLHTLKHVETLTRFTQYRLDYTKLLISSYLGSLIEYWVESNQPEIELYDLFIRALQYVNDKSPTWKAIKYFEKELCRILGYGSNVSSLNKLYLSSKKIHELRKRVEHALGEKPL